MVFYLKEYAERYCEKYHELSLLLERTAETAWTHCFPKTYPAEIKVQFGLFEKLQMTKAASFQSRAAEEGRCHPLVIVIDTADKEISLNHFGKDLDKNRVALIFLSKDESTDISNDRLIATTTLQNLSKVIDRMLERYVFIILKDIADRLNIWIQNDSKFRRNLTRRSQLEDSRYFYIVLLFSVILFPMFKHMKDFYILLSMFFQYIVSAFNFSFCSAIF